MHDEVVGFVGAWLSTLGLARNEWGNKWGTTLVTESTSRPRLRINVGRFEVGVLEAPQKDEYDGFLVIASDFNNLSWLEKNSEEIYLHDTFGIPRYYVWLTMEKLEFFLCNQSTNATEFRRSARKLVEIELSHTTKMNRRYNHHELKDHLIEFTNLPLEPEPFDLVESRIKQLSEGTSRSKKHKYYERNPKLRKLKLDVARKHFGFLRCEACHDLLADKYFTDDIVEVHHIEPMATGRQRMTKIEDAAILCRNCHRAIHILIEKNAEVLATRENNYTPIFSENFNNQRRQP